MFCFESRSFLSNHANGNVFYAFDLDLESSIKYYGKN